MKKIFYIALVSLLVFVVSCEDSTNYSYMLKEEQKLIDSWIERNKIEVLSTFPADSVFKKNQYYHKQDGIYFRLEQKGVGDTIVYNQSIGVRYIQSTLNDPPITESYWTTEDLQEPIKIKRGIVSGSCYGWNYAVEYMQKHDAIAEIIVPSKLGFDGAAQAVVPVYYKLKIQRLPQ